jgi:hypothetical protein
MLGSLSQRRCCVAGEQHDRNASRSWLTLQILNQLPSLTATQRQVGDDDVRMNVPSSAVSLLAISGPECLETESGKTLNVQFARVVVIVDDEYQRPGRRVPGTTAIHRFVRP